MGPGDSTSTMALSPRAMRRGDPTSTMVLSPPGEGRGGLNVHNGHHCRWTMARGTSMSTTKSSPPGDGRGGLEATPSGNGRGDSRLQQNSRCRAMGGTYVHIGNYRRQAMRGGYSTSKTTSLAPPGSGGGDPTSTTKPSAIRRLKEGTHPQQRYRCQAMGETIGSTLGKQKIRGN